MDWMHADELTGPEANEHTQKVANAFGLSVVRSGFGDTYDGRSLHVLTLGGGHFALYMVIGTGGKPGGPEHMRCVGSYRVRD